MQHRVQLRLRDTLSAHAAANPVASKAKVCVCVCVCTLAHAYYERGLEYMRSIEEEEESGEGNWRRRRRRRF